MPELTEDGRVLSWASVVEDRALEQARVTASMPFVVRPLALMPDAHLGKGSTIGSVIATEGAIIPAAVGVDIGCGMAAVDTGLTSRDLPDDLGPMMGHLRDVVPAGMGKGHEGDRSVDVFDVVPYRGDMGDKRMRTARSQYGSLGSGNHFVEICLDEGDAVWIVLHSGSRGIGNQLAREHIDRAKGLMRDWFIQVPDPDLSYLPQRAPEFKAYVDDLHWAQAYAAANRERMMERIIDRLSLLLGTPERLEPAQRVNCHHNFTQMEHHHGRNLWITRKGAIQAREGQLGIIPGSMGTCSYIVRGKGSPASYQSSAHGAGRTMSRTAARRSLSVESLQTAMGDRTWNDRDAEQLLDEHPDAYKPIERVMADQSDLVDPVHRLTQILNYKGVS